MWRTVLSRRRPRRCSVPLGRRGTSVRLRLSVASLLRGVRAVGGRRILTVGRRVLACRRGILTCGRRVMTSVDGLLPVWRRVLALGWILAGRRILLWGWLAVLALARIALMTVGVRHLRSDAD